MLTTVQSVHDRCVKMAPHHGLTYTYQLLHSPLRHLGQSTINNDIMHKISTHTNAYTSLQLPITAFNRKLISLYTHHLIGSHYSKFMSKIDLTS